MNDWRCTLLWLVVRLYHISASKWILDNLPALQSELKGPQSCLCLHIERMTIRSKSDEVSAPPTAIPERCNQGNGFTAFNLRRADPELEECFARVAPKISRRFRFGQRPALNALPHHSRMIKGIYHQNSSYRQTVYVTLYSVNLACIALDNHLTDYGRTRFSVSDSAKGDNLYSSKFLCSLWVMMENAQNFLWVESKVHAYARNAVITRFGDSYYFGGKIALSKSAICESALPYHETKLHPRFMLVNHSSGTLMISEGAQRSTFPSFIG